ncbi:MAG: hypothetical protein ACK559_26270, partial [bacterium]
MGRFRTTIQANVIAPVTIPVTNDRQVTSLTVLESAVAFIHLPIAIGVDHPQSVSVNGNLFDPITVEIAHDR